MNECRTTKVCNICQNSESHQIHKRNDFFIRGLLTCSKCKETRVNSVIEKIVGNFAGKGYTSPAMSEAYKHYLLGLGIKICINRDLNGSLNILEILKMIPLPEQETCYI